MLRGIPERLEAAEIDGRLDFGVEATARPRFEARWDGGAAGSVCQRFGEAAILEQRRVDAVRKVAKVLHRLLNRRPELADNCLCPLRIRVDERTDRAEICLQRDEMLLRAVVQVAFDPPPLLVGSGHDARSRQAELDGLSL